jgi:hypothetical protein
MATQLLKPSSESWCLVCRKCKKECCTCVFNKTINCKKYLPVERTAISTPPMICELYLLYSKLIRQIHRQNSHTPRGRLHTGRREEQTRKPSSELKTSLYFPYRRNVLCGFNEISDMAVLIHILC